MGTTTLLRAGLAGLLLTLASCSEGRLEHAAAVYPGTQQPRYAGTLVSEDGGRLMAEGIWRFFWRNGQMQALGDFRSGEPPSAADELDDHTQIPREGRSGHWREWSESGALLTEGCYCSGKRAGPWFVWYEDGKPRAQSRFVDGRESGEQSTWHPSGALATQGRFEYGRKDGVQREWDEAGVLRQQANCIDGVQEGLCTLWDEHGMRREQAQYRKGLLHGTRGLWNARGELTCISHYEAGQLEGEEELYHANGQVRVRGSYEHGDPVGKWTAWDEDGVEIWSREERAPRAVKVARGEQPAQRGGGN
jgi:antitoxin component YwqK of YwqJK toxin-antitoxin module